MNYLIQRGKVRGQVINVPEGLPELLSDITREVLRCQPTTECLCQFIIDYCHSIIVTREKARAAKSIIDRALRIVDEIISDMCICSLTKERSEELAGMMEECFKKFLEKRRCEHRKEKEIVKFNEVDMLDELIKRCKFSEDELKISEPMIQAAYDRFVEAYMSAAEGTEGTEALYNYFKDRELKRNQEKLRNSAATKIQANFRGFMVRRHLFVDRKEKEEPEHEIDLAEFEEMDAAARKIQKFFRKMRDTDQLSKARHEPEPGEICTPTSRGSMEATDKHAKMAPPTDFNMVLEDQLPAEGEPEPEQEPEPEPEPEPLEPVEPEPEMPEMEPEAEATEPTQAETTEGGD